MAPKTADAKSSAPCKRCFKVAQTGLKCIKCKVVSHSSFVGLLKNIRIIDDRLINCCENDTADKLSSDSVYFAKKKLHLSRIEISYLKELLKHKDLIIQNQEIAIKALNEQIKLLKSVDYNSSNNKVQASPSGAKRTQSEVPVSVKAAIKQKTSTQLSPENPIVRCHKSSDLEINKINQHIITADEASKAIHEAETLLKCQELIHKNNEPFKEVVKRKRKRRNTPIIGQLDSNNDVQLKLTNRQTFFHVYKLTLQQLLRS